MATFFLQGEKFIGKSTLLQEALKEHKNLTGFYVERIIDETGEILAFELRDAREIVDKSFKQIKTINQFIVKKPQPARNLEVFENFGCQLLEQARKASGPILLDEIGGIELLAPEFTKSLMTLLKENRPILGVLKSEDNYQNQKKNSKQPLNIDVERELLQNEILKYGQVRTLDRMIYQEIKSKLQRFLAE